MTNVLSKLFDRSVLEKCGYSAQSLSKGLVTLSVVGYIVKLAYPHILNSKKKNEKKLFTNENNNFLEKPKTVEDSDELEKFEKAEKIISNLDKSKNNLPGLNFEFLLQLKKLIEIMIPSVFCQETGLLGIHTLCLFTRTFLSIYVAAMEGAIVKFIVKKDFRNFMIMLLKWFGIAIPATFINSMIRYLENKLALAFR